MIQKYRANERARKREHNIMQITELLTPHYEAAWLPWAVQYFFLVGMATGAALLAAIGCWAPAHRAAAKALPLAKKAAPSAACCRPRC